MSISFLDLSEKKATIETTLSESAELLLRIGLHPTLKITAEDIGKDTQCGLLSILTILHAKGLPTLEEFNSPITSPGAIEKINNISKGFTVDAIDDLIGRASLLRDYGSYIKNNTSLEESWPRVKELRAEIKELLLDVAANGTAPDISLLKLKMTKEDEWLKIITLNEQAPYLVLTTLINNSVANITQVATACEELQVMTEGIQQFINGLITDYKDGKEMDIAGITQYVGTIFTSEMELAINATTLVAPGTAGLRAFAPISPNGISALSVDLPASAIETLYVTPEEIIVVEPSDDPLKDIKTDLLPIKGTKAALIETNACITRCVETIDVVYTLVLNSIKEVANNPDIDIEILGVYKQCLRAILNMYVLVSFLHNTSWHSLFSLSDYSTVQSLYLKAIAK